MKHTTLIKTKDKKNIVQNFRFSIMNVRTMEKIKIEFKDQSILIGQVVKIFDNGTFDLIDTKLEPHKDIKIKDIKKLCKVE